MKREIITNKESKVVENDNIKKDLQFLMKLESDREYINKLSKIKIKNKNSRKYT